MIRIKNCSNGERLSDKHKPGSPQSELRAQKCQGYSAGIDPNQSHRLYQMIPWHLILCHPYMKPIYKIKWVIDVKEHGQRRTTQ
jgi:hypothetical protein